MRLLEEKVAQEIKQSPSLKTTWEQICTEATETAKKPSDDLKQSREKKLSYTERKKRNMSEHERYEEAPETKRSRNDTVEDALRTFMETLSKNDQPPPPQGGNQATNHTEEDQDEEEEEDDTNKQTRKDKKEEKELQKKQT